MTIFILLTGMPHAPVCAAADAGPADAFDRFACRIADADRRRAVGIRFRRRRRLDAIFRLEHLPRLRRPDAGAFGVARGRGGCARLSHPAPECTALYAAVDAVNAGIVGTIYLNANGSISDSEAQRTYVLSSRIRFDRDVTVYGNGAILRQTPVVSSPTFPRVLFMPSGVTVTMHRVELTGADFTIYTGQSARYGAGVQNNGGTLRLLDSAVYGNTAVQGAGGIWNQGTLELTRVRIEGNRAGGGGGLYQSDAGTINGRCVRVINNTADYGVGLLQAETPATGTRVTFRNSSFYGNVTLAVPPQGADIYNLAPATVQIDARSNHWGTDGQPAVGDGQSGASILTGSRRTSDPTLPDAGGAYAVAACRPNPVRSIPARCTTAATYCSPQFWPPTPTPTRTATATRTPSPTRTPSNTRTPSRTPSSTRTPRPTRTPSNTPTYTPTFAPTTSLDFNGIHSGLKAVMFWAIFNESSSDNFDSGSAVDDFDLGTPRFTSFLFQTPYCSPGTVPGDNGAELPYVTTAGDWYIRHCPFDYRYMVAQTVINGFLNYERRVGINSVFECATQNFAGSIGNSDYELWNSSDCQSNAFGATYGQARINSSPGTGYANAIGWLNEYMLCLAQLNSTDYTAVRVRRAYQNTIWPQVNAAVQDFYSSPTDPTDGAFSALAANFGNGSLLACVGGCRLQCTGPVVYQYEASPGTYACFATPPASITQADIAGAYQTHIQQISSYTPNYNSVAQPVLRLERDLSGVVNGYVWLSPIYQQSLNTSHVPR